MGGVSGVGADGVRVSRRHIALLARVNRGVMSACHEHTFWVSCKAQSEAVMCNDPAMNAFQMVAVRAQATAAHSSVPEVRRFLNGQPGYVLADPSALATSFSASLCLQAAKPRSKLLTAVGSQAGIWWPVFAKLSRTCMVRAVVDQAQADDGQPVGDADHEQACKALLRVQPLA